MFGRLVSSGTSGKKLVSIENQLFFLNFAAIKFAAKSIGVVGQQDISFAESKKEQADIEFGIKRKELLKINAIFCAEMGFEMANCSLVYDLQTILSNPFQSMFWNFKYPLIVVHKSLETKMMMRFHLSCKYFNMSR